MAILAALPNFFTPSTQAEVRRDVGKHPSWVADDDGRLVGFVLAPRRFAAAAEITFAGVVPDQRGQGVGTWLVDHAVRALGEDGVAMVEVKTLDASADYKPSDGTRAFWERHGFIQIDCIDPLPGWDPGSPTAIYAKTINPPR